MEKKNPLKTSKTFFNHNVFHDLLKMYFSTALPALKMQSHQQLTNAWERGNQTDGYFHLPSWAACEKTNKQTSGSHGTFFWLLPFKEGLQS